MESGRVDSVYTRTISFLFCYFQLAYLNAIHIVCGVLISTWVVPNWTLLFCIYRVSMVFLATGSFSSTTFFLTLHYKHKVKMVKTSKEDVMSCQLARQHHYTTSPTSPIWHLLRMSIVPHKIFSFACLNSALYYPNWQVWIIILKCLILMHLGLGLGFKHKKQPYIPKIIILIMFLCA